MSIPPPHTARLQGIFIFSLVTHTPLKYDGYQYPRYADGVGWLLALVSMVTIPGYLVIKLLLTPGFNFRQVNTTRSPW